MTVIALWAHPRSVSTAFLRMMAERGDLTVFHEPLVRLVDTGAVELPCPGGGTRVLRSIPAVLDHFRALAADRTVFFKDTLEYHYQYLFDRPGDITAFRHTFIVREPAATIASHHAMKPGLSCADVGYEHQYALFCLAWQVTGRRPVVVAAERMLADPAAVVAAYCAEVGLPFLLQALTWAPGERQDWHESRRWHVDAIASSGFRLPEKDYAATVTNDARLRRYYDHHLPFYEKLIEHAL